MILSQARTGSNLLLEILISHPHIYAEREIFQRLGGRSVDGILDGIYPRAVLRIRAIGFKVFYEHPFDDRSGILWDRLTGIEDLHVIHLRRQNMLRTLVSIKIAHQTKVRYETRDSTVPSHDRQIEFTEDQITRFFQMQRAEEGAAAERFREHRMLDVRYEDLVARPDAEFRRITDFLGLKPSSYRTTLGKQNPEHLPQLITNYDQLKERFSNTEWACHFDD